MSVKYALFPLFSTGIRLCRWIMGHYLMSFLLALPGIYEVFRIWTTPMRYLAKTRWSLAVIAPLIPSDVHSVLRLIVEIFHPFFKDIIDLPLWKLVLYLIRSMSYQYSDSNVLNQGKVLDHSSIDFIKRSHRYSRISTAAYGRRMVQIAQSSKFSWRNYWKSSDSPHLVDLTYQQVVVQHSDLDESCLLYESLGGEQENPEAIYTSGGLPVYSPPYFLLRDESSEAIVLVIRGTASVRDFITDFCSFPTPFENGLGHGGMMAVAESIIQNSELSTRIKKELEKNPGFSLICTGHSLGGGIATAVSVMMRLRNLYPCVNIECFAFAPPPLFTVSMQHDCSQYVHTFVNEDDMVPRLNSSSLDELIFRIQFASSADRSSGSYSISQVLKEIEQNYPQPVKVEYRVGGTVYYLHPFLDAFGDYEEAKRLSRSLSWVPVQKVRKYLLRSSIKKMGCIQFNKGYYPPDIRLSPFVIYYHFVYVYEANMELLMNSI